MQNCSSVEHEHIKSGTAIEWTKLRRLLKQCICKRQIVGINTFGTLALGSAVAEQLVLMSFAQPCRALHSSQRVKGQYGEKK